MTGIKWCVVGIVRDYSTHRDKINGINKGLFGGELLGIIACLPLYFCIKYVRVLGGINLANNNEVKNMLEEHSTRGSAYSQSAEGCSQSSHSFFSSCSSPVPVPVVKGSFWGACLGVTLAVLLCTVITLTQAYLLLLAGITVGAVVGVVMQSTLNTDPRGPVEPSFHIMR
jgi:hypothetical protein